MRKILRESGGKDTKKGERDREKEREDDTNNGDRQRELEGKG